MLLIEFVTRAADVKCHSVAGSSKISVRLCRELAKSRTVGQTPSYSGVLERQHTRVLDAESHIWPLDAAVAVQARFMRMSGIR